MKNYKAILSLCLLAACSSKAAREQEIAEILTSGGKSARVSPTQISKLNCENSDNEYHCEFVLYGKFSKMTLVRVGDGFFSRLK